MKESTPCRMTLHEIHQSITTSPTSLPTLHTALSKSFSALHLKYMQTDEGHGLFEGNLPYEGMEEVSQKTGRKKEVRAHNKSNTTKQLQGTSSIIKKTRNML